jgi:putative membrane protein insertion efficiency factor
VIGAAHRGFALLGRGLGLLLIGPILAYRYALSPLLGPRCRFLPSCSEYAIEAIQRHGPLLGAAFALRRIARCHPLGGSGYDPVPESRCRRISQDEPPDGPRLHRHGLRQDGALHDRFRDDRPAFEQKA